MSHSRKRKGDSKAVRCVFFPDEVKNEPKKAGVLARSPPFSAIKSWERCGDGFLVTPALEKQCSSVIKTEAVRQTGPPASASVEHSASSQDSVPIQWSSSESELSDSEAQPPLATDADGWQRGPGRRAIDSYNRYMGMISASTHPEDEPDEIDWESDINDEEEAGISDCDSCAKDTEDSVPALLVTDAEISDYSSSDEPVEPRTPAIYHPGIALPMETGARSASKWVNSVKALLRTPQKQEHKPFRTPEDSAKKKKKFLRGGLADRLNRLQCRQRCAVSFWRHQSRSAWESPADRPGVLVLELVSVREECSMHMAVCHWVEPHSGTPSSLLVLFDRETAAQLMPCPGDHVRVYPPWQKLTIAGESLPIILNTHFSQKVENRRSAEAIGGVVAKRAPYALHAVFSLAGRSQPSSETQLAATQVSTEKKPRVCDSLLEVLEGNALAGWGDRGVSVLVQRVYCLHLGEPSLPPLLKRRAQFPGDTPSPSPLQQQASRLCLLVQDVHGMFSEVRLHASSPSHNSLLDYTRKWEGHPCVLRGLKAVQRVARGRSAWLFNLIDSLWTPAAALGVPGTCQSSQEGRGKLPVPNFCYVLSGRRDQGCVEVDEVQGQATPLLYRPAQSCSLREVLQSVSQNHRCTFTATVIYKRLQSASVGRRDFWLFVTDFSLQDGEEGKLRRTVPVYVSTSCVLHSSVTQVLRASSACRLTFKDAVKEHGGVLCVERTVIQPEVLRSELVQPIHLDQLSPDTPVNTLCTLKGVVIGVDENTAFSWPVCNLCGSDKLQALHINQQRFFCGVCDTVVDKPTMKMQLEVFLSCPSITQCTVRVKLQEDTITSVLNSAASGNEGYEVENVLGMGVGPLSAYVLVVTRKPALCIGLEEISLSGQSASEALRMEEGRTICLN